MDRGDPVAERPDKIGVALQKQVIRVEADHGLRASSDQAEHLGRGAADAVGHILHTKHRADLFRRERQPADGVGGTAFAFAALLLRNGPRSGMQHQPLGTEDGGQPDHPFDIGHIPLTLFGIDDRDVAFPAERQVTRPDLQSGFIEPVSQCESFRVTLGIRGFMGECVERHLDIPDPGDADLGQFLRCRSSENAERGSHRPGGVQHAAQHQEQT